MWTKLLALKSIDDTNDLRNNDILFEYHEQDLGSSTTVTTLLDVIVGVITLNDIKVTGETTTYKAAVAYTDGVITVGSNAKTVTVNGDATKFFLVGKIKAREV